MTTQEKLYSFLYKIRANPDTNTFNFKINKKEAEEARKYFKVHGFNVIIEEKKLFGIHYSYQLLIERSPRISYRLQK